MKRKKFIQQSLLATGGMAFLPVFSKIHRFTESSESIKFHVNEHIRHGFYEENRCVNRLDRGNLTQVCIDLFKHPDRDFKLVELRFDPSNYKLGIHGDQLFVDNGHQIEEVDLSRSEVCIWSNSVLEIFKNSESIPPSLPRLALNSNLYFPQGCTEDMPSDELVVVFKKV